MRLNRRSADGRGNRVQRLARVNRTQAFLGALGVVVVGLLAPGWFGATVLFALVVALLAVMVQTVPVTRPAILSVRLLILAGLTVIALSKIL
jgi:hypothetical protein